MIIPLTNPKMVDDLLPLVLKVPNLSYSPHGYLNYIKRLIASEFGIVLVNINDENKIDGFAFAETIISITDREAMLNLAYVEPEAESIGKEMWTILEKWARLKECKRICCITKPINARAMTRKYGFDHHWSYLTKELKEA